MPLFILLLRNFGKNFFYVIKSGTPITNCIKNIDIRGTKFYGVHKGH